MSDKSIPRVLRVEHVERDSRAAMMTGVRSSHYHHYTAADVMTPFGSIPVYIEGFHCTRKSYPKLITLAMDKVWRQFCDV